MCLGLGRQCNCAVCLFCCFLCFGVVDIFCILIQVEVPEVDTNFLGGVLGVLAFLFIYDDLGDEGMEQFWGAARPCR